MSQESGGNQGRQSVSKRRRTEDFLRATRQDIAHMPIEDVQLLVHELQIYQIELEMQNEELRRTQQELATARDRYNELYDFAPVGYVTLDQAGVIVEANLTATTLLEVERTHLLGVKLSRFVASTDQNTLYRHYQAIRTNSG